MLLLHALLRGIQEWIGVTWPIRPHPVAVADQLRLEHIPAGSNRDDEMHVDGGVVSQVFLFPRIVLLAQLK